MPTTSLTKVTENALFLRAKQALLAREGQILRRCPYRSRAYNQLGCYFTVGTNGFVTATHQELPVLARELKVLRPGEVIVRES
jgi:hypothetical protein